MNHLFENQYLRILCRAMAIFACLAFSIPLLGYILTGGHMRLSGDDYCYMAILRQLGFWKTQWNSYFQVMPYSGNRYSLTLFAGLIGLFGPKANSVAPGLVLVIWILSSFWLCQIILPKQSRFFAFNAFLISAIVIFFSLSMSPSLEQSLYWRSAMLPYFMPIVTNTILIGFILNQGKASQSSTWKKTAIFLLAFIAGGFSETGAAFQMGYLSLWIIIAVLKSRRKATNNRSSYALLSIALFGTFFAILLLAASPTNAARRAQFGLSAPPGIQLLLQMSLKNTYIFIYGSVKWLFLPHFLIFLFFALYSLLFTMTMHPKDILPPRALIISMALLPLMTIALILCIFAPSAWAQSSYPVARALIMGRLATVLASVVGGWTTGKIINHVLLRFIPSATVIYPTAILILLALTIFPIKEAERVFSDLPRYERWSTAWDARDHQIRDARDSGIAEIDVMEIDHIIPDVAELQPDPDFWYNNCAEWYYDIRSISASQNGWDN
jgi:hypothetical protein